MRRYLLTWLQPLPGTKAEPQDQHLGGLTASARDVCAQAPCSSIFIWFFVNRTVYRDVLCSPLLGLKVPGSVEILIKLESASSLRKPSKVKDWLIQTKAEAR